MKKIIKNILILTIFIIIFIILSFYKSKKNIFEDITILGLWDNHGANQEYEIPSQNPIKIDVFNTINDAYKKVAPGAKGSFIIKFKRPIYSDYKIYINEKTTKPKNLVFLFENKAYLSIEDMEEIINEKFMDTDKIIINWEWKYYINENQDIQDTKDGKNAERYIFEIQAIVEERNEI